MAKTNTQNTPDELRGLFRKSLEQRDRFTLGVVQGHKRLPSKRQRRLLRRALVLDIPTIVPAEFGLADFGLSDYGLI
jgi:hypothetical protein